MTWVGKFLRVVAASLVLIWAALAAPMVSAQSVPEGAMKASYVYNFMRYTTWPTGATNRAAGNATGGHFALCLLGADALTPELSKLQGRNLDAGKIHVVHLNSTRGIRDCHALFISERDIENVGLINRLLGDAPVLTLADSPQASDVAINLVLDNDRVSFDVNVGLVKIGGINLSSKVLRLARSVKGA